MDDYGGIHDKLTLQFNEVPLDGLAISFGASAGKADFEWHAQCCVKDVERLAMLDARL